MPHARFAGVLCVLGAVFLACAILISSGFSFAQTGGTSGGGGSGTKDGACKSTYNTCVKNADAAAKKVGATDAEKKKAADDKKKCKPGWTKCMDKCKQPAKNPAGGDKCTKDPECGGQRCKDVYNNVTKTATCCAILYDFEKDAGKLYEENNQCENGVILPYRTKEVCYRDGDVPANPAPLIAGKTPDPNTLKSLIDNGAVAITTPSGVIIADPNAPITQYDEEGNPRFTTLGEVAGKIAEPDGSIREEKLREYAKGNGFELAEVKADGIVSGGKEAISGPTNLQNAIAYLDQNAQELNPPTAEPWSNDVVDYEPLPKQGSTFESSPLEDPKPASVIKDVTDKSPEGLKALAADAKKELGTDKVLGVVYGDKVMFIDAKNMVVNGNIVGGDGIIEVNKGMWDVYAGLTGDDRTFSEAYKDIFLNGDPTINPDAYKILGASDAFSGDKFIDPVAKFIADQDAANDGFLDKARDGWAALWGEKPGTTATIPLQDSFDPKKAEPVTLENLPEPEPPPTPPKTSAISPPPEPLPQPKKVSSISPPEPLKEAPKTLTPPQKQAVPPAKQPPQKQPPAKQPPLQPPPKQPPWQPPASPPGSPPGNPPSSPPSSPPGSPPAGSPGSPGNNAPASPPQLSGKTVPASVTPPDLFRKLFCLLFPNFPSCKPSGEKQPAANQPSQPTEKPKETPKDQPKGKKEEPKRPTPQGPKDPSKEPDKKLAGILGEEKKEEPKKNELPKPRLINEASGKQGEQGKKGEAGKQGEPTVPGKEGQQQGEQKQGQQGKEGQQGQPSVPGEEGKQQGEAGQSKGQQGQPGEQGQQGQQGQEGKQEGETGNPSIPGQEGQQAGDKAGQQGEQGGQQGKPRVESKAAGSIEKKPGEAKVEPTKPETWYEWWERQVQRAAEATPGYKPQEPLPQAQGQSAAGQQPTIPGESGWASGEPGSQASLPRQILSGIGDALKTAIGGSPAQANPGNPCPGNNCGGHKRQGVAMDQIQKMIERNGGRIGTRTGRSGREVYAAYGSLGEWIAADIVKRQQYIRDGYTSQAKMDRRWAVPDADHSSVNHNTRLNAMKAAGLTEAEYNENLTTDQVGKLMKLAIATAAAEYSKTNPAFVPESEKQKAMKILGNAGFPVPGVTSGQESPTGATPTTAPQSNQQKAKATVAARSPTGKSGTSKAPAVELPKAKPENSAPVPPPKVTLQGSTPRQIDAHTVELGGLPLRAPDNVPITLTPNVSAGSEGQMVEHGNGSKEVNLHPGRLARQPPEVQRFVGWHEVGHTVGTPASDPAAEERRTDRYALERGMAEGWLDKDALQKILGTLTDMPDRVKALRGSFEAITGGKVPLPAAAGIPLHSDVVQKTLAQQALENHAKKQDFIFSQDEKLLEPAEALAKHKAGEKLDVYARADKLTGGRFTNVGDKIYEKFGTAEEFLEVQKAAAKDAIVNALLGSQLGQKLGKPVEVAGSGRKLDVLDASPNGELGKKIGEIRRVTNEDARAKAIAGKTNVKLTEKDGKLVGPNGKPVEVRTVPNPDPKDAEYAKRAKQGGNEIPGIPANKLEMRSPMNDTPQQGVTAIITHQSGANRGLRNTVIAHENGSHAFFTEWSVLKDGTVVHTGKGEKKYPHAGGTRPWGRSDLGNGNTVGIEFEGSIGAALTEAQKETGKALIRYLQERYGIPSDQIVRHGKVNGLEGREMEQIARQMNYVPGTGLPYVALFEQGSATPLGKPISSLEIEGVKESIEFVPTDADGVATGAPIPLEPVNPGEVDARLAECDDGKLCVEFEHTPPPTPPTPGPEGPTGPSRRQRVADAARDGLDRAGDALKKMFGQPPPPQQPPRQQQPLPPQQQPQPQPLPQPIPPPPIIPPPPPVPIPESKITCTPGTVIPMQNVKISWLCINTQTAAGVGFDTKGFANGEVRVLVAAASTTREVTYTVRCGNATERSCTIKVVHPALLMIAQPNTIPPGKTTSLAWAATQVKGCTVVDPECRVLGKGSVGGRAKTKALTRSSIFMLMCDTITGAQASTTATVKINGDTGKPLAPCSKEISSPQTSAKTPEQVAEPEENLDTEDAPKQKISEIIGSTPAKTSLCSPSLGFDAFIRCVLGK